MRLCSIASGSSGNCIYVGTDHCNLLVDAGVSGKRIELGLNQIGLKTSEMQGILVTHEHSDHISGLGVLSRKYKIPIYATKETIRAILATALLGKLDESLFMEVKPDMDFLLQDIKVNPFSISHDAANPVAYVMEEGKKRVAVATDMGKYDEYIIDKLQGLDVLLLEANHDIHMLEVGAYPYPLKRRILGDKGHLSNEASGQLLGKIMHENMKSVVLGHLSKENNYAELAYETVRLEALHANPELADQIPIQVANRSEASAPISI